MQEHQRSIAFTQLWYLGQAQNDKPEYYQGLTYPERQALTDAFTDILEIERRVALGAAYKPPVVVNEPKNEGTVVTPPSSSELQLANTWLLSDFGYNAGKTWITWADDAPTGASRGTYANGYPKGAVIHWTAGHRNGLKAGNQVMRDTGMLYLLIDHNGVVAQSNPLNQHGYHAGASSYAGLSGTVSDELVGIELMTAGSLTKYGDHYYPWWDKVNNVHQYKVANRIPANEVYHVATKTGNIVPGYYHKYTIAQINTLLKLCVWLYLNKPSIFKTSLILGHDEVSPGRKNDPGGAIIIDGKPYTMAMWRNLVVAQAAIMQQRLGK